MWCRRIIARILSLTSSLLEAPTLATPRGTSENFDWCSVDSEGSGQENGLNVSKWQLNVSWLLPVSGTEHRANASVLEELRPPIRRLDTVRKRTCVPPTVDRDRRACSWSTSTEMDGRHPGLVRHVGGALHSDSKEQTAMEETGSLRDVRPSALRMECDNVDDDDCRWLSK